MFQSIAATIFPCCCRIPPPPGLNGANDPSRSSIDAATPRRWTTQEKIGCALLVLTVVVLVLAAIFGNGVFDNSIGIAKANITSGGLAIGSTIPLIAGSILFFNICKSQQNRRLASV